MDTNKQILDKFGKLIINDVYDFNYSIIKENIKMSKNADTLNRDIEFYIKEFIDDVLFSFLKVFEENEEFKLYYEGNEQKVNLVEISEMLKAEPIIDNGWIERFSKELDNDKKTE